MEDNLNKMEDNLKKNGRRPKRKIKLKMVSNKNGRRPQAQFKNKP